MIHPKTFGLVAFTVKDIGEACPFAVPKEMVSVLGANQRVSLLLRCMRTVTEGEVYVPIVVTVQY